MKSWAFEASHARAQIHSPNPLISHAHSHSPLAVQSQKENKELEKRRRTSINTSMREAINKHLDHIHVMERGRTYALTELEDED